MNDLDLKTLEKVKIGFDICSDLSTKTMGYKHLLRLIEETKLNNLIKPDVSGSLIIGTDICNKGGTGTACGKCGDVRNCINDR